MGDLITKNGGQYENYLNESKIHFSDINVVDFIPLCEMPRQNELIDFGFT